MTGKLYVVGTPIGNLSDFSPRAAECLRNCDFIAAEDDIPSYEVIDEGITSLSIDWEMMGNEAANFVLNNVPIQKYLPTEVRLRNSL